MPTHVTVRLTTNTALANMNEEDIDTLGKYDIVVHADVPPNAIVSAAKDAIANDVAIHDLDNIDITVTSPEGVELEEDFTIESYSWNDMASIESFERQVISL
jgi:hypothetical protein